MSYALEFFLFQGKRKGYVAFALTKNCQVLRRSRWQEYGIYYRDVKQIAGVD